MENARNHTSEDPSGTSGIAPNEISRTPTLDVLSTGSSNSKRSMILGELEDELERQLEEKAKRNELSAQNVKSLLRAVLIHEDVLKYVDYALNKSHEQPEFHMKLTRAKAKELIDKIPDIAPLLCLATPKKQSDIDVLINEDLPEDSSDEEYKPVDETVDDDDSMVMSPRSEPDPIFMTSVENIGQRTRSKLSLSETPLETIEQAFVPPDITEDMYNTHCDNQDWLNFLKELVQPLDATKDVNDDENDPEYNILGDEEFEALDNEELRVDKAVKISRKEVNDLMSELFEYTQMHEDGNCSDEENLGETEENLKKLITQQPVTQTLPLEVTTTIAVPSPNKLQPCPPVQLQPSLRQPELCPSGQLQPSLRQPQLCPPGQLQPSLRQPELCPPGQLQPSFRQPLLCPPGQLQPSLRQPQPYHPFKQEQPSPAIFKLVSNEQYLLIRQQMVQHVQLSLQSYLLSLGNPYVNGKDLESCKSILLQIKALSDQGLSSLFSIPTLQSSLDLMVKYEKFVEGNLTYFHQWNEQMAARKKWRKTKWAGSTVVHPYLMQICLKSDAFQFPLLLPKNGFKKSAHLKRNYFSATEDNLIAMGLDDCHFNLKMDVNSTKGLADACELIHLSLLPDRTPDEVLKNVKRKKKSSNPISDFFLYHKPPGIEHFVVPIDSRKKLSLLSQQDIRLIDPTWHRALYKEKDYHKTLLSNKRKNIVDKNS